MCCDVVIIESCVERVTECVVTWRSLRIVFRGLLSMLCRGDHLGELWCKDHCEVCCCLTITEVVLRCKDHCQVCCGLTITHNRNGVGREMSYIACLLLGSTPRLLAPPPTPPPTAVEVMGLSGNLMRRRWPLTRLPWRPFMARPALVLSVKFTKAQNFSFSWRTLLTWPYLGGTNNNSSAQFNTAQLKSP